MKPPASASGNCIPNASPISFPDILQNTIGTRYYNLGPGGFSERRGADFTFQGNAFSLCETANK